MGKRLLLRALESGEIQPVGSAETEWADVRVAAATDAEIESEVASKRFHRPLYYRLAGYPAASERYHCGGKAPPVSPARFSGRTILEPLKGITRFSA